MIINTNFKHIKNSKENKYNRENKHGEVEALVQLWWRSEGCDYGHGGDNNEADWGDYPEALEIRLNLVLNCSFNRY